MTEAPKEAWCKPYLGYDYVEDWLDGNWSSKNNGGERYIRADILQRQINLIEQLFVILDKTEETEEGFVFRPTTFQSSRLSDAEKLDKILLELKGMVSEYEENSSTATQ